MTMATESRDAPGWDSIDAAFAEVYPGVEPHHVAPELPTALGGALDGISAYAADDRWHLVTYGLTELYEKESDDPDVSGWGYELTLLTPRTDEPPAWAFELLLAVATQTAEGGMVFDIGHRLDTGHDITGGESPLTAVAFCEERLVTPSAFPFGRYKLLQLVGITAAELADMQASSTRQGLDLLLDRDPLLRTDPGR
jgi:suppressor of fused-like protein